MHFPILFDGFFYNDLYILFVQHEKAKAESMSMHTQYKANNPQRKTTNDTTSAEFWKIRVVTSSEKLIKIQLDFT